MLNKTARERWEEAARPYTDPITKEFIPPYKDAQAFVKLMSLSIAFQQEEKFGLFSPTAEWRV